MQGISYKIETQLKQSESYVDALSKSSLNLSGKAMSSLSKMPVDSIKKGVFATRDILQKVSGKAIKFKPWGAVKIANNISKWAGPVGAGIQMIGDAVEITQQNKREEELKEVKDEISNLISNSFNVVYELLNDNDKVFDYFAPQLREYEEVLVKQKQLLDDLQSKKELLIRIQTEFEIIRNSNEVIDVDYSEVK